MPYQSLSQLFYSDRSSERFSANEEAARRRLLAESTFRTGVDTLHGELFMAVPRELSLLNERVLRYERRISQLTRELPPVAHGALIRSLVVDEVLNSNDMEGVSSTRRQINDALASTEPTKASDATRRFREFARLYLELSSPDRFFPKSPEDVRSVYDLVMQGEDLSGNEPDGRLFRKGGVEVIGQGGRVLHRGLSPESAITQGIRQMLAIVGSEDMPDTYSAIIGHYVFEYVHPFYDGNGRTGRYLLALYLSRSLSVLTSLSLSRAIAENRHAYYKSFRDAESKLNHGELTLFVMNILENVQAAQRNLDTSLTDKRDRLEEAEGRLEAMRGEKGLNEKEAGVVYLLLQLALFAAFPTATLDEVAAFSGVKRQQARKYTRRLLDMDVIAQTRRRELHFTLSERARSYFRMESHE